MRKQWKEKEKRKGELEGLGKLKKNGESMLKETSLYIQTLAFNEIKLERGARVSLPLQ